MSSGVLTRRLPENANIGNATFDVAGQAAEDFEEEWRSNETSLFSLSGGDIEAALFDSGGQSVEDFEDNWNLAL